MILRAVSGIALCLALAACGERAETPPPQAHNFNAIDLSGSSWGRDFRLADTHGTPRSIADYRGKVVLLYFGYLNCPDMCPTTVAQMAQIRAGMGADRDHVQGLFVTVDPTRDTPAALVQYLASFDTRGQLRLMLRPGESIDAMTADVAQVLKETA